MLLMNGKGLMMKIGDESERNKGNAEFRMKDKRMLEFDHYIFDK